MTSSRLPNKALLILYACAFVYLAALLGMSVTRAGEPIQFVNGKPPSSLSVGQIIAEASLNGPKYAACKGDIFALFQGNLDKKLIRVGAELIEDALYQFKNQGTTWAICQLNSFLNNLCIYGNCKGGGSDCPKPIASDVTSYIKLNWKDKLKSNFLASCTSLYAMKFVGDTTDGIIQSGGAGGAPAYATDWVLDAYVRPDEQAYRRFWTILVNTDICPYFRHDVYQYFRVPQSYIDDPPFMDSGELRVNAEDPFPLTAGCTLPDDFQPGDMDSETFLEQGGFATLSVLIEPQNNLEGFLRMASEELKRQRVTQINAISDQLVAGGGFLPTYASSSCGSDPNDKCTNPGQVALPPGAVRDAYDSQNDALYAAIQKANGEDYMGMTDLSARLQVRLLGLMNKPIPMLLELALDQDEANFTPVPTATPTSDPDDPACIGDLVGCQCIKDNIDAQGIAQSTIGPAIAAAIQQYPQLFVSGTAQLVPGTNPRDVLSAICNVLGMGLCVPHTSRDNQVVIRTSQDTFAFDVITPDGYVRTNGGIPTTTCPSGIQD